MQKSFWLALIACALSAPAMAQECAGFKFDVSRELQLLSATHESMAAASSASALTQVVEGHVYKMTLPSQANVQLAAQPEKLTVDEGSYAGMVAFTPAKDGNLRVSLSRAAWVDVLVDNEPLISTSHSGSQNCKTLRKVVQFDVKAGQPLVLQLSGATDATVRLLVTQ